MVVMLETVLDLRMGKEHHSSHHCGVGRLLPTWHNLAANLVVRLKKGNIPTV